MELDFLTAFLASDCDFYCRLWCVHSVAYTELPSYFLAFDILDKHTNRFLSSRRVKAMLQDTPISMVPLIYEGGIPQNLQESVKKWIKKSHFGEEIAEGVYLRIEDDEWVIDRCK